MTLRRFPNQLSLLQDTNAHKQYLVNLISTKNSRTVCLNRAHPLRWWGWSVEVHDSHVGLTATLGPTRIHLRA